MQAVPLTSFAGVITDPALSPDGNQVAFVWTGEKGENPDLYLKLVGPGAPIRLTNAPGLEFSPAWSPDGRQIAFVRTLVGQSEIVVIPALGGPERIVAEGTAAGLGLAWSPDGQSLLAAWRNDQKTPAAIHTISVASGSRKRLTEPPAGAWSGDLSPALSPDGRTLAFARSLTRANSEIYLLPLTADLDAAGEPRRLTFENRASGQPVFTPDGKRVLFASGGRGADSAPSLMELPVSASGQKAAMVPGTEGGDSPNLSRQGRLVYQRWLRDENVWRLPVANGKAGAPERLVASTRRDVEPRFSADGKRIVFASDRSGSHEIWTANADGSEPVQVTSMKGTTTGGGRYSPDGKRIAFISNAEGQMEIYLTTPNGDTPRRLTNDPAHDSAPSFSRDGKWIYFASNRKDSFQVWKLPVEGAGAPVQVTRGGGYFAIESVDGRTLFYTKRDESTPWGIWKVPVEGGEEVAVGPRIGTWGDFDVTEAGITYIDSGRAGAKIRFFRFGDGSDSVLATVEKRPSFGVAVSPVDGSILYTQFDVDAHELMLVESFR